MKMIGDCVVVDFRKRAFLREDATGEIAEMIGDERNVGSRRLADRLAIVERLGHGEDGQPVFDDLRDFDQKLGAGGGRGLRPFFLRGMRGIERELYVLGAGACDLADRLAGDRANIVEILPLDRGTQAPPMKLS